VAVQSKLEVQHKDSMLTSGYAVHNGVCIKTDFHISNIFYVIFLDERCCKKEMRHRPRCAPELRWAMDVIYDFYYIHGPMEY